MGYFENIDAGNRTPIELFWDSMTYLMQEWPTISKFIIWLL